MLKHMKFTVSLSDEFSLLNFVSGSGPFTSVAFRYPNLFTWVLSQLFPQKRYLWFCGIFWFHGQKKHDS